ncbi:hypothetical protein WICPIJ_000472 [Wickerhamomyces pijperi]|uniref:Uncharacterized protein n=1 Tax=Wickerhamomyces pijperi TaxID=599730 RepID=A0A9P8TSI9_WICPI|nr:hypothetical protein WICPIJ_000472 [Wickerhamomyces pijperi]
MFKPSFSELMINENIGEVQINRIEISQVEQLDVQNKQRCDVEVKRAKIVTENVLVSLIELENLPVQLVYRHDGVRNIGSLVIVHLKEPSRTAHFAAVAGHWYSLLLVEVVVAAEVVAVAVTAAAVAEVVEAEGYLGLLEKLEQTDGCQ